MYVYIYRYMYIYIYIYVCLWTAMSRQRYTDAFEAQTPHTAVWSNSRLVDSSTHDAKPQPCIPNQCRATGSALPCCRHKKNPPIVNPKTPLS